MDLLKNNKNKPRILLVEDNPGDIRLTQEALKESQMEIHLDVVSDGEQAIDFLTRKGKYAEAARPHIILLDLMMPEMNGDQMLEELRATEWGQKPKVIILTNMGEQEIPQRVRDLGVSDIILKADMTPRQVADLVKKHLAQ